MGWAEDELGASEELIACDDEDSATDDWASDEEELCNVSDEVGSTADDVTTEEEDSIPADKEVSEDEEPLTSWLEDDKFSKDDEDSCSPIEKFDDSWAEDSGTLDEDSNDSCADEELKA